MQNQKPTNLTFIFPYASCNLTLLGVKNHFTLTFYNHNDFIQTFCNDKFSIEFESKELEFFYQNFYGCKYKQTVKNRDSLDTLGNCTYEWEFDCIITEDKNNSITIKILH
jgi:hypothetical protein